jgi:hypothetical protein
MQDLSNIDDLYHSLPKGPERCFVGNPEHYVNWFKEPTKLVEWFKEDWDYYLEHPDEHEETLWWDMLADLREQFIQKYQYAFNLSGC